MVYLPVGASCDSTLESAPLVYKTSCLEMGCLTTTDMVLREESNGNTFIISYSTRPSPEKLKHFFLLFNSVMSNYVLVIS